MKSRILLDFYSALIFLLESTKTSSMVEKSLNKFFQTSYTFLGGSKYQTSNDVIYPQFKSWNKHSSTLTLKGSYPWNLFMERRNTCLAIHKLLVLMPHFWLDLKMTFLNILVQKKISILIVTIHLIYNTDEYFSCNISLKQLYWDNSGENS